MSAHRESILKEMGIGPLWKLRQPAAAESAVELPPPVRTEPLVSAASDAREPNASVRAEPFDVAQDRPVEAPAAPALGEFDAFSPNGTSADRTGSVQVTPQAASPVATADWDELIETINTCRACGLCEGRKQAVPGVGDRQADWLFVGEGPGAEEDARGEPFVGQAGKLLDSMLAAIDLMRGDDVYIANAVKCRPPENRTPLPQEMDTCRPYLARQIELIRPRLIVALGRPAAQTLLQEEVKIGAARGQLFRYQGIPVIVTYHPAYLLRTLGDKSKAWEDLVFARRTMRQLKQD